MGIPAGLGVAASGLPPAGDQANAVLAGVLGAVGPGDPFAFRGPMNLLLWASFAATLTTTKGSLAATTSASGAVAPGAAVNGANVPPGTTWVTFAAGSGTLALPAQTFGVSGLSVSGPNVTLPPGSNVARLLGATVTVPSNAEGITLPAGTIVAAIVQADVAPSLNSPGVPGIVALSNLPTAVPPINTPLSVPLALRFALTSNAVATGVDAAATFTGAAVAYTGSVQIERSVDGGKTWIVCNIGTQTLAIFGVGTPISVVFGEPEKNVLYRLNCTAYTTVSGVAINYRISQTGGAAESLAIGPLSGG